MQYTQQADVLIATQEYFKKSDFEDWYKKENKLITYVDLMNFLMNQKQTGALEFAILLKDVVIDRELILEDEIKPLIKKINIDLLKKFFIKNSSHIGDQSIRVYFNRDKFEAQKQKDKKIKDIINFLVDNFDKIKKLV